MTSGETDISIPAHIRDLRFARQAAAHDSIFEPIVDACPSRPFVVAQLGQSLDGRIATMTGASRWINGESALDHLHRLRAHVDAVVVGVGTVALDDPLLTVRRVVGRQPARVIIDPNGRLSRSARCLAANGARCFVVRGMEGPVPAGAEPIVLDCADRTLDPARIVEALYEKGLRKILVEGGATTVSHFVDARMVDRIHLLVAPVILGSGVQGFSLLPIDGLEEALRPKTQVHILDDGDVLFDCDLRQQRRG